MIQTGDYDGPVAPIPLVNPAVVRPVYEKLEGDRAFIVAEASSHAQWTNYPLLPTAQWGFDIAKTYSVARSEEHTSELQSLMRSSYAVFGLQKNNHTKIN